jgi:hypothetical protein
VKNLLYLIAFIAFGNSASAQNIPSELQDFVPKAKAALDDLAKKIAIFDLPTGFNNSVLPKYYGIEERNVLVKQNKLGIIKSIDGGTDIESKSVLISTFDEQQNLTNLVKAKDLETGENASNPVVNYFDGKYGYSYSAVEGWVATFKNLAVYMNNNGVLSPAYYAKNVMDLEYFRFDNSKNAFVKEQFPLVTLNEKNQVATVKVKSNGATILRTIIYDVKDKAYRIHEMQLDNQYQQYRDLIYDEFGLILREQTSGGFVFEEFQYLEK